jgi:hypothetical protein
MTDDVYYNVTDETIFITTKWHEDPLGGPAFRDQTYSVAPGQGIDISVLGLNRKPKDFEMK